MADFFGFDLGMNFGTFGVGAGGILIFVVIIIVISKLREHRAEWGDRSESNVERKVNLRPLGRGLKGALRSIIGIKNKGKAGLSKLATAAKKIRKKSKSEKESMNAAVEGAKADEETEKSAEALVAIEGRAAGLIAGLKLIQQSIEEYIQRVSQEEAKELTESLSINGLIEQIKQDVNYNRIDSTVLAHLKGFADYLLKYLDAEISTEEGKEKSMKDLSNTLKEAITEMKNVLEEAKTGFRNVKKHEKGERKHYRRAIEKIRASIWVRRAKVIREHLKFKNKNNELISQLKSEIANLGKQYNAANRLYRPIKKIFGMIDNGVKECRRIIGRLLKFDKKMKSFDKPLNKMDSNIEKKFKELGASFTKFKSSVGSSQSSQDLYSYAIPISENLNEYFEENKNLVIMTSKFDESLRSIISIGFVMARLTESYEKLMQGLIDSEEGVEQGMQALEKVLEATTSESEMQIDEKEVSATLGQLDGVLDYEKKVEKYLSNLTIAIEYKLREIYSLINRLVEEDMKVVNAVEKSSANFGLVMSAVHNRTMSIGNRNLEGMKTFERKMNKTSSAMARSFSYGRQTGIGSLGRTYAHTP